MAKAAIVGALGVVIGSAIGFALGMTFGSPEPVDAARGAAVHDPDANKESSRADVAPEPGATKPEQGGLERARVATHGAPATALLESVDVGPLPSGDGTITGSVRTAAGAPVAGVQVTATPNVPDDWDRVERDDSPEAELIGIARHLRWLELTRITTTTGSDGAYELCGLGAATYGVGAVLDGYRMQNTGEAPWRYESGAVVDFVAHPLTQLSFVIRGPDGRTPKSANVHLQSQSRGRSQAWEPGAEPMEVEPGPYTLAVQSGDFSELVAEARDIRVDAGTDNVIEVELEAVSGIGGDVTKDGPTDGQSMQVWLLPVRDGERPTPGRVVQTGRAEHVWGHSRSPLRYSFKDLAPGTYALAAARQNALPTDVVLVEVGDRFVRQDLVVPDYDRSRCLEVAAFAPDGTPLTEFGGMVRWESESQNSSHGITPIRRPDGAVWIPLPARHDPEQGRHIVQLQTQAYGTVEREFSPGPTARVEVHFQEPARGTVAIAGYAGSGAEGRVTVTVGSGARGFSRNPPRPDAEGRMDLPATAPGTHLVSVRAQDQWGRGQVLAQQEVTLVSGQNDVTIALPALHTLTVEFTGAVAGRMVGVSREGQHGFRPVTPDETGRATFDLLPPGEYTVQIYNGAGGSKTVTIPGTTLVRFD